MGKAAAIIIATIWYGVLAELIRLCVRNHIPSDLQNKWQTDSTQSAKTVIFPRNGLVVWAASAWHRVGVCVCTRVAATCLWHLCGLLLQSKYLFILEMVTYSRTLLNSIGILCDFATKKSTEQFLLSNLLIVCLLSRTLSQTHTHTLFSGHSRCEAWDTRDVQWEATARNLCRTHHH